MIPPNWQLLKDFRLPKFILRILYIKNIGLASGIFLFDTIFINKFRYNLLYFLPVTLYMSDYYEIIFLHTNMEKQRKYTLTI